MKTKLNTIEVFNQKGLKFENLVGWEGFDYLSQLIEKIYLGEQLQFIMEGLFGVKWYYINKIVFELIYDEDIGIYLKLLDKYEFIENYINEDIGKGFKVLGEVDFSQIKKNRAFLKEIANDIIFIINSE